MAIEHDDGREERALDALIVLALLSAEGEEGLPDLDGPEPSLSVEDRRALRALGPDLVKRIVRGEWRGRPRRGPR
jgi:hypothetical protein